VRFSWRDAFLAVSFGRGGGVFGKNRMKTLYKSRYILRFCVPGQKIVGKTSKNSGENIKK